MNGITSTLSIDDYWTIVRKRRLPYLLALVIQEECLVAILDADQQTLKEFGYLIGDIFQLSDDTIQSANDTKNKLSKKVDQDFQTGDISLLMILAAQHLNSNNSDDIKQYLSTPTVQPFQTTLKKQLKRKLN